MSGKNLRSVVDNLKRLIQGPRDFWRQRESRKEFWLLITAVAAVVAVSASIHSAIIGSRERENANDSHAEKYLQEAEDLLEDAFGQATTKGESFVQRFENVILNEKQRTALVEAKQLIDKARELRPRYAEAERLDGVRLILSSQSEEARAGAIMAYKRALEINPNFARAYVNLANAMADSNDWAGASRNYELALQNDPQGEVSGLVYLNYANAMREQRELVRALALLQKGAALEPNNYHILNQMGIAYQFAGDLELALKSLDRAVAVAPERFVARHNRAEVLLDLGRYEEAVAAYEFILDKYTEVEPSKLASSYAGYGQSLEKVGRDEAATAAYREAVKRNPDIASVVTEFGKKLESVGLARQAIDDYKRALGIDPDSVDGRSSLCRASEKIGDLASAEAFRCSELGVLLN